MRRAIMLSTGREVHHRRLPNGSRLAFFPDGEPFSEAEWQEYIALLPDYHSKPIVVQRADSLSSALLTVIGG